MLELDFSKNLSQDPNDWVGLVARTALLLLRNLSLNPDFFQFISIANQTWQFRLLGPQMRLIEVKLLFYSNLIRLVGTEGAHHSTKEFNLVDNLL